MIVPVFQPIHTTGSNNTMGAEVLARWLVNGVYYTPSAISKSALVEHNSIYWENTDLEIIIALVDNHKCIEKSYGCITINISEGTLKSNYLFTSWLNQVEKFRSLCTVKLMIEITEGVSDNSLEKRWGIMKMKGIPLVMDDFGDLSSTFKRLQKYHWDGCKFNTKRLTLKNKKDIEGFEYCKEKGIPTVGEHVATARLSNEAEKMGVDLQQGFYLGKPTILKDWVKDPPQLDEKVKLSSKSITSLLTTSLSVWALAITITLSIAFLGGSKAVADPGCQDAEVIGPKMITDICWSCIFPLRVAGVNISGGGGSIPDGAVRSPLCMCDDNQGVAHPGVTTSMWEPARLVEFQRVPGCSSVLNGTRFPFDRINQGHHGEAVYDGGDSSFTHYHYYTYPIMQMLDMFVKQTCNPDGFMDLDIMYLSELDPTWNNDELAFFTNPESAAVANPVATLACTADAVSSTAGKPIKELFWCAGSWGNIYPLSGNQNGGKGVIRDTSLLSTRVLAALHRRGLAYGTMGSGAMCGGNIEPTLPKTQYKFTMLHPVPETESSHVIGESTLTWGLGRTIPAIGQDPIYMIWRWNDCCNL